MDKYNNKNKQKNWTKSGNHVTQSRRSSRAWLGGTEKKVRGGGRRCKVGGYAIGECDNHERSSSFGVRLLDGRRVTFAVWKCWRDTLTGFRHFKKPAIVDPLLFYYYYLFIYFFFLKNLFFFGWCGRVHMNRSCRQGGLRWLASLMQLLFIPPRFFNHHLKLHEGHVTMDN